MSWKQALKTGTVAQIMPFDPNSFTSPLNSVKADLLEVNMQKVYAELVSKLKVIPQYCIAHPICAQFLASLARAHSTRTFTTWQFLYELKLAREIKGHFLLNEYGDLSFFCIILMK